MMGNQLGHQYEDPLFRTENTLEDMIATIKQRNQDYQTWGWKLPNNINYLSDLLPHLRNPIFINVIRNPLAIACSSATHDQRELTDKMMLGAINHTRKVQKFLTENPSIPSLFLQYEDVIHQPDSFCDVLEQFIQYPIDRSKVLPFLSKKTYISPKQFTGN
ncbi:sulfotransferase [Candidatus Albibeggiatoa sp. nov. BB20]|uniref:sulfotransferase n=1 Tax=Candidatus Albibeggiatoa sp. nov. BB20 TaxID=3162723 RepID=UPI0033654F06